jgi:DNA-binding transcriptional MerR regulator
MRRKYGFMFILLFLGFSLSAYDEVFSDDSKISEEYVDALVKARTAKQQQKIAELEERLDELEDSIEKVETRSLVDKVSFGVGFSTAVNNYYKKYADGHKESSKNLYTTKLMLNMKSKIADNMIFQGRLSMYKYWADSTIHMFSRFDSMQGRVPGSSAIFVERAFVDWRFTDKDAFIPSVLTIGRQPSSDGPCHQYKANTSRKATYSALVFDGASDGIVLTSSLKNILPVKGAKLRVAYGKGFQNDQTKTNVTNAFIGADNSLKDTDVYGLFLESNLFGCDNTLFQVGVAKMKNIIANALDTNASANKNIGDVTFAGMMFEGTNIQGKGLDLFAHFAYSDAKPSGKKYNYMGRELSLLGKDGDTDSKDATAFWIGGRYELDENSKFGLEYNQAGKNWISATQGAYDLVNKLATRGKAVETYYIHSINRYSFVKFGGMYVDYDYTNSGWFLGEPKSMDSLTTQEAKNNIESIKNIYLQFGLNY